MGQIAEKQENVVDQSTALIQVIERAAVNPDVDVEKMERLLDMQERILNRNAMMAFNQAFTAMQSDIPEITESGAIMHGQKLISKYAKFEDINAVLKPILQRHGFAISFRTETGDSVRVTAVLSHKDGHSESTDITLPADTGPGRNDVQAVASAVTYGKRYTMSALLNISTRGSDDDGVRAGTAATLSDEQVKEIRALLKKSDSDETPFINAVGSKFSCKNVSSVEQIPAVLYSDCVAMLNAKMAKAK